MKLKLVHAIIIAFNKQFIPTMTQGTYSSKEGTKCLCPEFHIVVEFEERAKVRKKHWRNLNVIYAVQQWKKQVLKSLIKRRVFKGDYPASGNISSQNFGFCVTDGQPMHIIQICVLLTLICEIEWKKRWNILHVLPTWFLFGYILIK